MTKILGTNFVNALQSKTLQAYEMIEIKLQDRSVDPPTDEYIRLTNAPYDITRVVGEDYTSVGGFLGFSEIKEEQEFGVTEVTVSLTGLPLHDLSDENGNPVNLFSQFLEYEYVDRPVKIYRAFFSEDQLVVDGTNKAILLMFDGLIDAPVINDDPAGTTTVSVKAVNQWVDFQRTNGRHTNDAEQTFIHPNDKFFRFAKDSIKDIQWKKD